MTIFFAGLNFFGYVKVHSIIVGWFINAIVIEYPSAKFIVYLYVFVLYNKLGMYGNFLYCKEYKTYFQD